MKKEIRIGTRITHWKKFKRTLITVTLVRKTAKRIVEEWYTKDKKDFVHIRALIKRIERQLQKGDIDVQKT